MARQMKESGIDWVGRIPNEWHLAQLKRFVTVNNGREILEEIDKSDDAIPVYGSGGVFKYTSSYLYDGIAVLFGRKGTLGKPIMTSGKIWVVDTMYYLTYSPKLDPKFNYFQLQCFDWVPHITHTALPSIVASEIVSCSFAFPPFGEQKRIATFLEAKLAKIDTVQRNTRFSIDEYKRLKQSIIAEAVTKGIQHNRQMKPSGVAWTQKIPVNWSVIPSKYVFHNSDERKHEGDVLLTSSQKHGIISQTEYMERENAKVVLANKGLEDWKHVEPYDFVISLRSFQGGLEMSETTGCITWHYIVLKPCREICSDYYKWLFKSEVYIKALQRTCNFIRDGQDLRYSNFVQVPLVVPPIAEQKEIADYLDKKCAEIDTLISKKAALLGELENYKKSIIYEYVTGKKEVQ